MENRSGFWAAATAAFAGVTLAALVLVGVHAPFPGNLPELAVVAGIATALAAALMLRAGTIGLPDAPWWITLAAAGGWAFALLALYSISFYLRFPVDFLNFWEGDFLGDIIKLRRGLPLYTDPTDNNSSVYTPGAQLLTDAIARLIGVETSIPALRTIQFSYAMAAAAVATSACDLLARRFLRPEEYRGRAMWWSLWFPLLLLVATERQFGQNVHALHPDSLTLLISAGAFWLLCRHALTGERWTVVALALVPAVGFWSKQSLLLWGGLSGLYFLASGQGAWRRTIGFGLLASLFLAGSLFLLFEVGGPHTWSFVFGVLGAKTVSLARSVNALLAAGGYGAMGLAAFWLLVAPDGSRSALTLWGVTAILFMTEAYTTGIGWQKNHLGPGVLFAAAWLLAALPRLYLVASGRGRPAWALQASFAAFILLAATGLGLTREPKNGVPADTGRYIAAIEKEFADLNPREVLLDQGAWRYFADTVLMKDRASSVALWVGRNQPTITREMLTETIRRVKERRYRRILVRDLDHGSTYDYQDRGSGVKDALLANYREVRRIPGVAVEQWWPKTLLSDISVLEPRPPARTP